MNITKRIILTIIMGVGVMFAFCQTASLSAVHPINMPEKEVVHKHSLGSSLFLLGNLAPGDPVRYFHLNYGYQLTPKENVVVEAVTWTYYEPLGTYDNSEEMYPGKVQAFGIGVGYQRFHWKGAFTTVEATPFMQQFYNEDNEKLQKGFQLYLQGIAGYRFEFMDKRWFIEPAYAIKYWPVNTNFPDEFDAIEQGKPKHIFEPNCNFGYRF